MSDRDRRIDSLFAERVLGLRLDQLCDGFANEDGIAQWRCDTCHAEGRWDEGTTHNFTPAPYTRSLDAAWEGADNVKGHGSWSVGRIESWPGSIPPKLERPEKFVAEFWADINADKPDVWARADHPAEALVLACLRAVGCTEEEISGA